jgi:hypothetical protein
MWNQESFHAVMDVTSATVALMPPAASVRDARSVACVSMTEVTEQFCIDMECWFYCPEDTNNDIKNNHCQYRLSPLTCKRTVESLENDGECEKEMG